MSRIYRTLGTVAMTPKGEYDSSAYYEKLNIVDYQGSSYVAKQNVNNILPTDETYWLYLGGGVKITDTLYIFDTVAAMKASTKLKNGFTAQTLGYYSINDGGGSTYKITDTESEDEYQEELENGLYSTLILTDEMNLTQFGVDHTSNDVTQSLNKVVKFCSQNNICLIIPAHTYNLLTPLTKTAGSHNYSYFIENVSNMNIKGIDKEQSVLKVPSGEPSYTSIFFNNEDNISNINLSNFTIEQYYLSGQPMLNDRSNNKNAFTMFGECKDISINNIIFKNCCGIDTIAFHKNTSSNIRIENNFFDYHYVRDIAYYDRSIVYMECHDYVVKNNIVNGNFETLGGIECHGYNGICSENFINKCQVAVHIAPRYSDDIESANINVSNNVMKDNAVGVQIWWNTDSTNTIGCSGLNICNNIIKISGYVLAQNFFRSAGLEPALYVGGILPSSADNNNNYNYSNFTINNNIISLKDYSDYISYTNKASLYLYSGIYLSTRSDMKNLHISNNTIEGMAGLGISIGDSRYTADNFATTSNVQINNNIINNCGYGAYSEASYKAYMRIGRGVMTNVIINNNIMNKTDSSYTTTYAVNSSGGAGTIKTNVYFKGNVIKSVLSTAGETNILNIDGGMITDFGPTAYRPSLPNIGDTYFDTGLNKLIVYNGTAWTYTDGTSV